ncbi:MAG: RNA polymerase subunit sigma [Bacteroidetes bacterium HGW-Bacteroidetes-1]|nr:MAG: RNA polymerase subunit sigma [Bacteroidetes bacterium HGW-Bacteroidetes-1]
MLTNTQSFVEKAAQLILDSNYTCAFTGAGISAESGIPPFRGEGGLWSKYNPEVLEMNFFFAHPLASWTVIKEIFYNFFTGVSPNHAHLALADWEHKGYLQSLITQNIDQLHFKAGNKEVYSFHGNSSQLICISCHQSVEATPNLLSVLPPLCNICGCVLKPDFIFFGEGIPEEAYRQSVKAAQKSQLFFIIGTSGEVSPANQIPVIAKESGAVIIEINKDKSLYTNRISDFFIQGKAGDILPEINQFILQTKAKTL